MKHFLIVYRHSAGKCRDRVTYKDSALAEGRWFREQTVHTAVRSTGGTTNCQFQAL